MPTAGWTAFVVFTHSVRSAVIDPSKFCKSDTESWRAAWRRDLFFRPTPSRLPPGRWTCLKACCNGINYLTKACVGRSCRVAAKVTGGGPIHSPMCCHDHPENKQKQSKQKHKQEPPQTKNKQKQKQTKQKPKRTPNNDVTATSCGWKRWIRARGDSLVSSQIMHDDSFVPW